MTNSQSQLCSLAKVMLRSSASTDLGGACNVILVSDLRELVVHVNV